MPSLRHQSRRKPRERGPNGEDRRRTCRYSPALKIGQLKWESRGQVVETPVVVMNVSMSGCLLKARNGPRNEPGLHVWFQSEGIEDADGVEAVLVQCTRSFFGTRTIRIRFLRSLAFDWFKNLVYGPEQLHEQPSDVPDHEQDLYWR